MGKTGGALVGSALLAGGGFAGFVGGRWLIARFFGNKLGPARQPSGAPRPRSVAQWDGVILEPPTPRRPGARCGCLDGPVSGRFDWLFEEYRGSIPIEYLRALAASESGMKAGEASGPAWGLFQIAEVVRKDYNLAHGTHHERDDLLDPAVSVQVATWLLGRIIDSYRRNHPGVRNLQPDWENPRFVELLTFGWNAGWSEAGGVGRVARFLEARGTNDITLDLVQSSARAAGASKYLSRADKVAWSKKVVALYQCERARAAAAGPAA